MLKNKPNFDIWGEWKHDLRILEYLRQVNLALSLKKSIVLKTDENLLQPEKLAGGGVVYLVISKNSVSKPLLA